MTTIKFEYTPPSSKNGVTFVGFNALTADLSMWESSIGKAVRDAGHGTLFWNLRGQEGTPIADEKFLGESRILADAKAILDEIQPPRPVLVGLSIGGAFAVRSLLQGTPAEGLVLLNTLRAPGPRLEWINAAVEVALRSGGPAVLRDMYSPLLYGDEWLSANRSTALSGDDHNGLPADNVVVRLLRDARELDWDLPYEAIDVPVLVVTGDRDCVFRVPADIDALTARIADVRTINLPHVGHLIPVEAPEDLGKLLTEFADQLKS